MWRVDLSDVTASKVLDGEKEIENITAWSTPRRNSASFVQFPVAKIRTRVPCIDVNNLLIDDCNVRVLTASLAVASKFPSGLRAIARNGVLCAGMILMLPVSSSIIWTWPGDRPGKASTLLSRQASPKRLSEVSKTESFWGGLENAKTWTLFNRTVTIFDLERRTPRTEVRNSSVIAAFCLASSHITN